METFAALRPEDRHDGSSRLVHIHIMKTGGTSLAFQWDEHRGAQYPRSREGGASFADKLLLAPLRKLDPDERAALRFASVHLPLCAASLFDGPTSTVVVFRDPVERAISQLRMVAKRLPDLSPDELYDIEWIRDFYLRDHQVRVLSTSLGEWRSWDRTQARFALADPRLLRRGPIRRAPAMDVHRLDAALRALDTVDVVGTTDRLGAVLTRLEPWLGPPPERTPARNRGADIAIGAGLRERIEADNVLDRRLYARALELAV